MGILRRLGSGFLFALAILGCILALGGIYGVWWLRVWGEQAAVDTAELLAGYVPLADQSIDSLAEPLAGAEQTVARVQAGISARLGDARATLEQARTIVATIQTALASPRDTLAYWMLVAAVALTPLLLRFAAGQVSLAAHAWGWMRAAKRTYVHYTRSRVYLQADSAVALRPCTRAGILSSSARAICRSAVAGRATQ